MRRLALLPLAITFAGACTLIIGDRRMSTSGDGGSVDLANANGDGPGGNADADKSQSTLMVMPASVLADGSSTAVIVLSLREKTGLGLSGRAVILSSTGTANTFQPAAGMTDATGVFAATLVSTVAELKQLTVTAGGITLDGTVTFVAGNSDNGSSLLVAQPTSLAADGVATSTLTVTVKDVHGNAVSGQAVTLSATGSANTITPLSGNTDTNGSFTATISSTKAEMKVVSATVNGFSLMTPITFVAGALDATVSTVVANPTTNVVANGSAASTVTVTTVDAQGNPIANQAISVAASGGGIMTPASGNTNGSGVFTSKLTSTTAGAKTITASAGAVPLTTTPSVTFVACPSDIAITPGPTVTAGNTTGATNLFHPVCAQPTDAPERLYGFTLGVAQSIIVDRSSSFAGAVTDLRTVQAACGSDAASLVCSANRFLYCPTVSAGTYELAIDGSSGAVGSFGINVAAAAVKGTNSYGLVTTPQQFSSIASVAIGTELITDATIENGNAAYALPFNFKYFGVQHTAGELLTIYQSGYVSFGTNITNTLQNVCPLSTNKVPLETIMPYWSQLESRPPSAGDRGSVWVSTQGSAPNRKFTVEWNQMDAGVLPADTFWECIQVSVQVILDEATGQIEFRYLPEYEDMCSGTTPDRNFTVGGHQTIGLQSTVGSALVEQASCNTALGTGPAVLGSCVRPGGNAVSTCTGNKGYLFVPRSVGCP